MPRIARPDQTPHAEAVSSIEELVAKNLGGNLEATAECNQCGEKLTVNLVEGASSVSRETLVGTVRPDISLLNENGEPVRFIEVDDSHAPEGNVHEYALHHEFRDIGNPSKGRKGVHRQKREQGLGLVPDSQGQSTGARQWTAHCRCPQPPLPETQVQGLSPLPPRTVTVSTQDCWKCGQNVNAATGDKDGEALEQDYFTTEEIEFAQQNGVTLERRFSTTVGGKYLANVCTKCDQIQGDWFLYIDPFHDRFNLQKAERQVYGPCDRCATQLLSDSWEIHGL